MDALNQPEATALQAAASRLIAEFADQPVALGKVDRVLQAVLFGQKQGWACCADGLLTDVELADLVASWLVDLALRHRQAPCPREQTGSAAAWQGLYRALFGRAPPLDRYKDSR